MKNQAASWRYWNKLVRCSSRRGGLSSFCALGAVEHLSNNDDVRRDATYLLEDQIHYGSLVEWNDKRGRTKQQVIKLFDKAIEKAKR